MEAYYFDVSALTFEELFEYLFTSPEEVPFRLDPSGKEFDFVEIQSPEIILQYLTRLCADFAHLAQGLTRESLERGIDQAVGNAGFELEKVLWSDALPLEPRLACPRSMYRLFADYVAKSDAELVESCFYMWWDYVCHSFWLEQTLYRKLPRDDYAPLGEADRELVDVMFETLIEILKLDGERTNRCALHGLGHLHHPGVAKVVQEFIDSLRIDVPPDTRKWLEGCRDGSVM